MPQTPEHDLLSSLRQQAATASAKEYWRSLDELAGSPAFQACIERELPQHASEWPPGLGRRAFLRLAASSLALAGISACTRQPPEAIRPYVASPPGVTPGEPLLFATAMPVGGYATGLLVRSHEGRPTKIEGNPDHPASLGAADRFCQASILDLYDPDRSRNVLQADEISSWSEFLRAAQKLRDEQRATPAEGAGLYILTDTVSSPALAGQLQALLSELPGARWHQWEPLPGDAALLGAELAFGTQVESVYHLEQASRILAVDSDFLSCGPGSTRYAHDFALRRRPEQSSTVRLYAVESSVTNTGAVADHRLPLRPSEIEGFMRALAAALGVQTAGAAPAAKDLAASPHAAFISALARDLIEHRGQSLILIGGSQPAHLHALCHVMNGALNAVGSTVVYTQPVAAQPVSQLASLRALCAALSAGRVDTLLILDSSGGCNPVYSAPVDLRFPELMKRARLRVHFGPYFDESAAQCDWHLPAAHYLESWGDARAYDGTVSIVQPLIAPLYDGRTAHEVLAAFSDSPERRAYDIVRSHWQGHRQGFQDFDDRWQRMLDLGVVPDTAFAPLSLKLRTVELPAPVETAQGLELSFRSDPAAYDGRFANNPWLQELPRPLDRLTWDNVALLSPRTAQRLGLAPDREALRGKEYEAEVVEVSHHGRRLLVPVWIQPGQPEDCMTLTVGCGRQRAGHTGNGVGYDAYSLRTAAELWAGRGLEVKKTGKRHSLASAQLHFMMAGRGLIRSGTLEEFKRDPHLKPRAEADSRTPPRSLSLYPDHPYRGHAWGMAIDLSACLGCGACVVACQAENNTPVVGKQQVLRGREMHWLRIDRYYQGAVDNPASYFQPVPCMHCENAPCEYVCPVNATVHSAEGLNDMVYNRCIGTRYCSNNCPYKVRRFNFLAYSDERELARMQKNPEVTVRSRGVMEKCTYCIQRITAGRIRAEEAKRRLEDGEIETACQATCPAGAIVFGDINDPLSRVARLKGLPRSYALLGELNTRPRTTYLAAVRNPNPAIPTEED